MESYTLRVNGFDVIVTWSYEHISIQEALGPEMTGADHSETIEKVLNGELLHMIIDLTAYKKGVELASISLGGCIYTDLETALKDWMGGYLPQMLEEVTKEARQTIKSLVS